jgi:hypothetical protein
MGVRNSLENETMKHQSAIYTQHYNNSMNISRKETDSYQKKEINTI